MSSLSVDTMELMKTREFSEEVLKWVRAGWIPLEEQELMRGLFYEGEFQALVHVGEKRVEEEKAKEVVESDEETIVESSDGSECMMQDMRQLPLSLKRPEEAMRVEEDVESFFDEVEQQQPRKESTVNSIVQRVTNAPKRARIDSPPRVVEAVTIPEEESVAAIAIPEEESVDEVPGGGVDTPKSQTPVSAQNQVVEVVREVTQSDSVHSPGRGKRFKKNNIRRATTVTPLQPYHMWRVCFR